MDVDQGGRSGGGAPPDLAPPDGEPGGSPRVVAPRLSVLPASGACSRGSPAGHRGRAPAVAAFFLALGIETSRDPELSSRQTSPGRQIRGDPMTWLTFLVALGLLLVPSASMVTAQTEPLRIRSVF